MLGATAVRGQGGWGAQARRLAEALSPVAVSPAAVPGLRSQATVRESSSALTNASRPGPHRSASNVICPSRPENSESDVPAELYQMRAGRAIPVTAGARSSCRSRGCRGGW